MHLGIQLVTYLPGTSTLLAIWVPCPSTDFSNSADKKQIGTTAFILSRRISVASSDAGYALVRTKGIWSARAHTA